MASRAVLSLVFFLAMPIAAAWGAQDKVSGFQNVLVRPGDTLWSIAHAYLRNPEKWDEILKYNKIPSSDPTVALPGMTLRVPVHLIKEDLRAAYLIYMLNRVAFRRQDTADWKSAKDQMELFRGDSLRTFESAKAKVKFLNAELLSLDANSMAIIKPAAKDYDIELKSGGVFVGRSKVVTASARITPKTNDTQYSAKVRPDLSTLVEVYRGVAGVDAQGKMVDVPAGMGTQIMLGMAPSMPKLIEDLPSFEARAADFTGSVVAGQSRMTVDPRVQMPLAVTADDINSSRDVDDLNMDMKALSIGQPVSGYHIQASRTRDFSSLVLDKAYSSDEAIHIKSENIPAGIYWWRIAFIDLLGTEQSFSSPRLYSFGVIRSGKTMDLQTSFTLIQPGAADEYVSTETYRVRGIVKNENLTVLVGNKPVRVDENGNFYSILKLKEGVNVIKLQVTDSFGHSTTLMRRVTYTPDTAYISNPNPER